MKKYILRGVSRIIATCLIAMCAWWLPAWAAGFVGVIIIDIYGMLIEKGKL